MGTILATNIIAIILIGRGWLVMKPCVRLNLDQRRDDVVQKIPNLNEHTSGVTPFVSVNVQQRLDDVAQKRPHRNEHIYCHC